MHFRAAALVVNLVHKLLHEEDAPSMLSVEILRSQWVRHLLRIEAGALVADNE
jgi:hypothetical protein